MAEPELLTVEDASRLLAVGRSTVYQWIAEGLVPTFRVHGVVRIPRSGLIRMIEAQVQEAATPVVAEQSVDGSGCR
jgi:excisionase family DNA binding protein